MTRAIAMPAAALLAGSLAASGCGGPGRYGHAREYVPLEAEEPYRQQAERIPYESVKRDPVDYDSTLIGWFGVVEGLETQGDGGRTVVRLSFRTHQQRHLCRTERESSCRVTVSEKKGGPFTALLELRPRDRSGSDRLWEGSLVKVYGKPTGKLDDRGGPVLEAEWYRHWPQGQYVTTAYRKAMRK